MKITPSIMGVLNVTPDSFSDGGNFLGVQDAVNRAQAMLLEGADIVDVGGESTRPGARPVSVSEEMDRVLPVIQWLVAANFPAPLSVDTRKFEVAEAAVRAGASIINDISGGGDPRLAELLRAHPHVNLVLMHMQGSPETMQKSPEYPRGVVPEVLDYLRGRIRAFAECGVAPERLWVDPGIGFGKTLEHNLELLKSLREFTGLAGRVVVGTSRKSFLGRILGNVHIPFEQRIEGTIASNLWAVTQGASVLRVHDVGPMKRALLTWHAIDTTSDERIKL